MRENIIEAINTQLDVLSFPKVLITLVIDYLNEPLPLTKEGRKSLAAFLLKIFTDLAIGKKNGAQTECEKYFLNWIPIILTAISEDKPVQNPTDQYRPMRVIEEDLLSQRYYERPEAALYDLLDNPHRSCREHTSDYLANFALVNILTDAKLLTTTRGLSFCIALHELAGRYRFNITKNRATALYEETKIRSIKLSDEKDQLRSRKKSYNQLGLDCRYLTFNEDNGYVTLFTPKDIKQVLALESKHASIPLFNPPADLTLQRKMIKLLQSFVTKYDKGPDFLKSELIKAQIGKCKHLIGMLETLDLDKNITVQTILSQVSVYKNNNKHDDFQKALEFIFRGLLQLSTDFTAILPPEITRPTH